MGVGSTARKPVGQQICYLGPKTVNFNDAGVAAGLVLGTLPAGSQIVGAPIRINTAFNAATTNEITIGATGDAGIDNIMDAGDFASEGAVGNYFATALAPGFAPPAADTEIRVAYNQTGTAATTGQAVVSLAYIPPDETP